MLPTKFWVKWPFSSGEEAENRFSRWLSWRPSWISDRDDFIDFLIYRSPWCFLPSLKSISLSVQEKKWKIDFQDGRHGSFLGFSIGTILANFNLCHSDASYQVSSQLAFGLGEEAKKRFSRWPPWQPSWISDQHDFSYFLSTNHPDASYQVLSQLAFSLRRRS